MTSLKFQAIPERDACQQSLCPRKRPRPGPRRLSKRDRILDAAQQLFAQGGFDGVSMRDIAAQAGVGLP